jgi:mannose-1-phosphate guanylyltransferase/phosphomannomutase
MEEVAHKKGVIFVGEAKGGFIFPKFHCVFDGMMATVKTLELLSKMGMKLSEVTRAVPPINIIRSHVPCPWELKGMVMRNLLEETQSETVELVDGIKIFHNQSWVLIIPDGDRPFFHVNAEAGTREEAQVLITRYTELIRKIQNRGQKSR